MAILPKHPVPSVIGFLKGKSAIAIARLRGEDRNFSGEHFWARGCAVSTVGFELEQCDRAPRDAAWVHFSGIAVAKDRYSPWTTIRTSTPCGLPGK